MFFPCPGVNIDNHRAFFLESIGFKLDRWDTENIENYINHLWNTCIQNPQIGQKIGYSLDSSMLTDNEPVYHNKFGHFYLIGRLFGDWYVYPTKNRPLASPAWAFCLVPGPRPTGIEHIEVIGLVEKGIVVGEYFEPSSIIAKH